MAVNLNSAESKALLRAMHRTNKRLEMANSDLHVYKGQISTAADIQENLRKCIMPMKRVLLPQSFQASEVEK